MNIQNLTFEELADAIAHADQSRAERLAYERLVAGLSQLPGTRERLAFDMVEAARKFVNASAEPGLLACWIRRWSEYVSRARLEEFTALIEELSVQYSERFGTFEMSTPELTLPVLLSVLQEHQPARLACALQRLKEQYGLPGLDIRRQIIREFEVRREKGDTGSQNST